MLKCWINRGTQANTASTAWYTTHNYTLYTITLYRLIKSSQSHTIINHRAIRRSHIPAPPRQELPRVNPKHHTTHDKNNTTNDHTKNHPPHSTTIGGGAATVRTTSHTRVGGRDEVSVGGRVEVRRALGRARVRRDRWLWMVLWGLLWMVLWITPLGASRTACRVHYPTALVFRVNPRAHTARVLA